MRWFYVLVFDTSAQSVPEMSIAKQIITEMGKQNCKNRKPWLEKKIKTKKRSLPEVILNNQMNSSTDSFQLYQLTPISAAKNFQEYIITQDYKPFDSLLFNFILIGRAKTKINMSEISNSSEFQIVPGQVLVGIFDSCTLLSLQRYNFSDSVR